MIVPKPVKLGKKDVLDLQQLLLQPQDPKQSLKSKNHPVLDNAPVCTLSKRE